MLDTDTKRRIDTARDILVGKVPDPKSQVEQITIALIYKFMDDIDAESEEFGGKRSFFSGEFTRYGWAKLMRPGLGGHDTLNLYAEAIAKMPENPGIPPLFRDIFNNAYLPYRDPETLRAFLKAIDDFTYDHSESLGDAFEYLLSVLGSQGDAGQFRTPRHIIDFIVEVVDPKKDDLVLDPACGTSGFLISSYKHILAANSDPQGNITLTPDDKNLLAENFKGYDISPDMVRLSLANMYLHGFTDPHIIEYDTLTSEERWNEYADVILANPPFMSPKGGIRPHNRFSVQSKRSEVLFVDYMTEHLTPSGRAGIIVPEGVIFQSQGAYKQLRKMLVEEYLVAVVSLPAGVFNPYSGVKTSILILDKSLAKKANTIAFFKIENDGFDLGAQRRPKDKDDLPQARTEIADYLHLQRAGLSLDNFQPALGLLVEKEKIATNGDYNLSGERYRESGQRFSRYPHVELGDVCDLYQPKTITQNELVPDGPFLVFGANGIIGRYSEYNHEDAEVVITCRGATCGTVKRSQPKSWITGNAMVAKPKDAQLSKNFLFEILRNSNLTSTISGSAQPQITRQSLAPFLIPLPPIGVQKEIVAEIEGYRKVIDGACAVVDNYRLHIPIDPAWPMASLGDHFAITSGGTPSKAEARFWTGTVPWVSPKDMKSDVIEDTQDHISEAAIEASATKLIPGGSVICVVRSGILKHSFPVAVLARDMCINQDIVAFRPTSGIGNSKFLFYVLKTKTASILQDGIKAGVTVQSFYNGFFRDFHVPLPPAATQQEVISDIEAEQVLVAANQELIERMEKKIQASLAHVWEEGASAQAET